ncbi:MAG: selenocysteine-specific translation elongation factor [Acidimicrobiia bacterium]|nr:selenocysteine-specific translation elongation factor [Acidimicrobiia bacterium]
MLPSPTLPRHFVIGTAGHIDHGKSRLVLALTGTDPDRLPEEKARGITIDLGFAHTTAGETVLSFVDVPGHERFVRNMLAGAGGIDAVLLVVDAGESVMPQTREHVDICRLLGIRAGVVAIARADRVDRARVEQTRTEVARLVAGTFLEGAPMVAVSAVQGEGLDEIRRRLTLLATRSIERPVDGPPRLAVDRVFAMRGFGTVVTGTLTSGRLTEGDDLVLLPSARPVRIRGLQVHGERQASARSGQRVAVNLAGVDRADVSRGETLTAPGALRVTRRIDVELEVLASGPALRHGTRVRIHAGTGETAGRVTVVDGPEIAAGRAAAARLHLRHPAALTRGDRVIVRALSPAATIGGGWILDPCPPSRGARTTAGRTRARRLAGDAPAALLAMVEDAGLDGLAQTELGSRCALHGTAAAALVTAMQQDGRIVVAGGVIVSAAALREAEQRVLAEVRAHHDAHPRDEGLATDALRTRVFGRSQHAADYVFTTLARTGRLRVREWVALADHSVPVTDDERALEARLARALERHGLSPPDVATLARDLGASPAAVEAAERALVKQGTAVRAGGLAFAAAALERLQADVRALKADGTSTLDVAAFKSRWSVTRKHAIPLLEFLDRTHVTRRTATGRTIL